MRLDIPTVGMCRIRITLFDARLSPARRHAPPHQTCTRRRCRHLHADIQSDVGLGVRLHDGNRRRRSGLLDGLDDFLEQSRRPAGSPCRRDVPRTLRQQRTAGSRRSTCPISTRMAAADLGAFRHRCACPAASRLGARRAAPGFGATAFSHPVPGIPHVVLPCRSLVVPCASWHAPMPVRTNVLSAFVRFTR